MWWIFFLLPGLVLFFMFLIPLGLGATMLIRSTMGGDWVPKFEGLVDCPQCGSKISSRSSECSECGLRVSL